MDMITRNEMVTITDNIEFKSIENVNDNLIKNEILKANETGFINKLID
ncbi:DNA repair helicase Rad25 [Clostridium sporogenes]|nr:DNA repair helicase Rad25 [Clostridium sporogenes]